MDAFLLAACLIFGASFCCLLFLAVSAWFQWRLNKEFDRGFRAGRNPEAGGWVYLLASSEIVTETTSPPELKDAPGCFVPLSR